MLLNKHKTKYIVVTGGVLSGLGKGVVTASIGKILKEQGYNVNAIKIDPYINVDAGTMRPTEHGEVFVTFDGGETDQDIGTYERFLEKKFSKINNITTGKVYRKVIRKERNLEYKGICVEVIPHIPNEVNRMIRYSSKKNNADFTLIEVGGTVGDYQNILFLETFREMKLEKEGIIFIHVVYLPVLESVGEMKTKPAQHSVRALNSQGIQPDFIVARSIKDIDDVRRKKISLFCNVAQENIISAPDSKYVYSIPILFENQGFSKKILGFFSLKYKEKTLDDLRKYISKIELITKKIRVGIVGKYFDIGNFVLEDSYISVIEAVKHACWYNGISPEIKWVDSKNLEKDPNYINRIKEYDAVIVPGGFGHSGVEGKIKAIKYCRENEIPCLGLCYGMQLMVIEFARNVCKMKDANSTEIDKFTIYPVIDVIYGQKKLIEDKKYGGTMRLGEYKAILKKGSLIRNIYGKEEIIERHRHRYEVNLKYINKIENHGLIFSGKSLDGGFMEFCELKEHPFFIGTQAHPEFQSCLMKPSPVFEGLIKAGISKINN